MARRNLLISFVFCALISVVSTYPTGAPPSTCLTMFPKHVHKERQETPCPFTVVLSSGVYRPLQLITVSIDAPPGKAFRGIQIRAHRVTGDKEAIFGTFEDFPAGVVKPYSCFGGANNMITHRSGIDKTNLTMTWRAPAESVGNLVFTATIVETHQVFWIDQRSPVLTDPTASSDLGTLEKVSNVDPVIRLEGCGETKGCLLYPRLCRGASCDAAVSFTPRDDWIHFELLGRAEGYVSVGFSHDKSMTHDETLTCTAQGSRVTVQRGYNPALFNERQYTVGIVNMTTVQKDGLIYCRFSRPRVMSVTSVSYSEDNTPNVTSHEFDLGLDWFIMLAWGYTYEDTDVVGKHVELPIVTHKIVSLSSTSIHYGTTFPIWLQLHSSLAILAWVLLVGIGTAIGRHYRDGFGARMACGSKLWFQLHRCLLAAAFCSCAVAFILIFVQLQGWSKYAGAHIYLGIAIMAAMVLQIFAGIMRPSPSASIRPVFNWMHRILGKLLHIAAAVEIYLGFDIVLLPAGMRYYGSIAVYVWVAVQVFWEILFEVVKRCKSRSSNSDYDVSNQFKLEEKYPEKTNRASNILFFLYVLSMLAVAVASICVIKFY